MKRAIHDKLVSLSRLVTPHGASAAKDPPTETRGWRTYEKKVPIEAKRADRGGTLRTLEGPAKYRKGDFIARGAKGEKWPIRSDVFRKTYRAIGGALGVKTGSTSNQAFGVFGPRVASGLRRAALRRAARGFVRQAVDLPLRP